MTARAASLASGEYWDEVSSSVAAAYFPHVLKVHKTTETAQLSLKHVNVGPLTIARIGWGADVSVVSSHPGAYAINVPQCGYLEADIAGTQVSSVDGLATVCPPDTMTRMTRWTKECAIIGVKIEQDFLNREVLTLSAQSPAGIPAQLDLRTPEGRSWIDLVTTVGSQASATPQMLSNSTVSERLASAIAAAFVFAAFPDRDDSGAPARPRIVTRVLEAIEADPARAWTANHMALVAGVGVRRLQAGFHDYLGKTPTQALQDIRLERARMQLLEDRNVSVSDVAWANGFNHLGRFAAAYRSRFGHVPSVERSRY